MDPATAIHNDHNGEPLSEEEAHEAEASQPDLPDEDEDAPSAADPTEPSLSFVIDPHHGVDTTKRKLFVGGLAWQVRTTGTETKARDKMNRAADSSPVHLPVQLFVDFARQICSPRGADSRIVATFDTVDFRSMPATDRFKREREGLFIINL